MSNTTTHTPACAHCNGSTAGRGGANYTDHYGAPVVLCGTCWDDADGCVCDNCDRLVANWHDLDTWQDCNPGTPWRWADHHIVCLACTNALDVTRPEAVAPC
jgi:hypothetical protein